MISEGNVGLMQAVKKFEPEKGFRLATYAMGGLKLLFKNIFQDLGVLSKLELLLLKKNYFLI